MCGLAGAIEFREKELIAFEHGSLVHKYIQRRGPDYYGAKSYNTDLYQITQAHARLSIIDLTESSHQPFVSDNENFVLIYNGEIYNYIELRDELKARNIRFKTQGDTEVLLKAWELWGKDCLDKLNGMFVFSIIDKRNMKLYLVRDRFGVKPLAYSFLPNGNFFYSSSVDSVAEFSGKNMDLDYLARGYYFGVLEGVRNQTIYNSVKYLEAGCIMTVDFSKEKLTHEMHQWYNLRTRVSEQILQNEKLSLNSLLEKNQTLFRDAVSLRLRSDVPLAVSLSGGVDSTSIASVAAQYSQNISGFTYGHPNDTKSEGSLVAKFSNIKNIPVHYVWLPNAKDDIVRAFEDSFSAQELPFFGLSIIAQNQVYKAVKEYNVKVLLGGQGGDEIYAGYRKFFVQAMKYALHNKDVSQSLGLMYSLGNMMWNELSSYRLYWDIKDRYFGTSELKSEIFTFLPSQSMSLIGNSSVSLADRQCQDILSYSIPTLLRYEDRNSMYYSIESRLPFMDYRLVEFAISLPTAMKIKDGMGKWLLRETMKDDVPHSILYNKRKRGFDVTQNWMENGLEDYIVSKLYDSKQNLKKYNIDVNEKLISTVKSKKRDMKINDLLLLNYLTHK